MTEQDPLLKYREQHKHRLNYMPWLYWSLKPKIAAGQNSGKKNIRLI